jgi:outer membrane protein OmpA-like peptidoglycan-associated protein
MANHTLKTGLGLTALAGLLLAGCSSMSVPTMRSLGAAAPACIDANVPIYFAEGSSELTGPARDVIAAAGREASHCTVLQVEVVGLADYRGPPQPNLILSRQRAEHVAQGLQKAGLPAPTFGVIAAGESGAVTAKGDVDPLHRRAEIHIKYKH